MHNNDGMKAWKDGVREAGLREKRQAKESSREHRARDTKTNVHRECGEPSEKDKKREKRSRKKRVRDQGRHLTKENG